jgi:hypothetical protein
MTIQDVIQQARQLILAERADADERVERLVQTVIHRIAATGQTGGGAVQIRDHCQKDFVDRAGFARDVLIRAHEAVAPEVTDATVATLKQELRECINTDYLLLQRVIDGNWRRLSGRDDVPGELSLAALYGRTVQRMHAEIDLYIAELKQRGTATQKVDAARGSQARRPFVNAGRIEALKGSRAGKFDLSRLIRMCEELNDCSEREDAHATIMLTRAILDHVPPVFGVSTFAEVANNHGGRSFKGAMSHLENGSRRIADLYLHAKMRDRETLPNMTQVDFSAPLDLLLSEIERLSRS